MSNTRWCPMMPLDGDDLRLCTGSACALWSETAPEVETQDGVTFAKGVCSMNPTAKAWPDRVAQLADEAAKEVEDLARRTAARQREDARVRFCTSALEAAASAAGVEHQPGDYLPPALLHRFQPAYDAAAAAFDAANPEPSVSPRGVPP